MDAVMTEELKIKIFKNQELFTIYLTAIYRARKKDTKLNEPKTLAECIRINEGYRRVCEYLPTVKIDQEAYIRARKELKQIDFLSIAKDLIKLSDIADPKSEA